VVLPSSGEGLDGDLASLVSAWYDRSMAHRQRNT
jgi:hypothetical protein